MKYINHNNPKIAAIRSAQDILMAKYRECGSDRRKATRDTALMGMHILWNAVDHLAEQVKADSTCWVEGN